MNAAREWIEGRLAELQIPSRELVGAILTVDYTVNLHRQPPLQWLNAGFDFSCIGVIRAPDREYVSSMKAKKEWGLSGF